MCRPIHTPRATRRATGPTWSPALICGRTSLEVFGQRYGVGKDHLYTDYKELIAKEQPDILSIATQPEQRAEIAIYAAEHGVKALYCEKALCASLPEADAMVEAD